MLREKANYYDIEKDYIYFEEIDIVEPRICMHCKNTGVQKIVSTILTPAISDSYSGLLFTACSFCGCNSIHGIDTWEEYDELGKLKTEYTISESFPKNISTTEFSEYIKETFPDFIDIYLQSQAAEKADLNHLAGMGYRKSLEFLVTDFLKLYPVEGVEIEWLENPKTSLKHKIDKIQNARIKKLATAITYLGNDQTHYTQRHPEYDIQSIKVFIGALVSNIENEIALKEAEMFLNKS